MEELVGGCIESILALDYPADRIEVILVDNGSTDGTSEVISRYPVAHLHEAKRGASAARNAGVAVARGEIIASTDADCEVDAGWATEIDRTFQDPEVDAVMGFAKGISPNVWARLEQMNFEAFWYHRTGDGYSLRRTGIDTRNCAIRKDVFEQVGRMNEELAMCGDLELSVKLRASGRNIRFNDRMVVRHHNRTELPAALGWG